MPVHRYNSRKSRPPYRRRALPSTHEMSRKKYCKVWLLCCTTDSTSESRSQWRHCHRFAHISCQPRSSLPSSGSESSTFTLNEGSNHKQSQSIAYHVAACLCSNGLALPLWGFMHKWEAAGMRWDSGTWRRLAGIVEATEEQRLRSERRDYLLISWLWVERCSSLKCPAVCTYFLDGSDVEISGYGYCS